MKKRLLFPGGFAPGSCILLTGAINTMYLFDAAKALMEGTRLKGYSCKVYIPGMASPYTEWAVTGDPDSFQYSAELNIFVGGEYIGERNFRYGFIDLIRFSQCVFFSPAAIPEVAPIIRMPWEEERIHQIRDKLETDLGLPVSVASPSYLRPSACEKELLETTSDVLYYLERGLTVPTDLLEKRAELFDVDGLDQVPALERVLW